MVPYSRSCGDCIRMVHAHSAIVDCKYEILQKDGTAKKMWSSYIVVADNGTWKISAISNMLPATP